MHWSTTKREHASYVCADAHSTITLQNAQASVQILHTNQEGNTTWYACTHTAPPKNNKSHIQPHLPSTPCIRDTPTHFTCTNSHTPHTCLVACQTRTRSLFKLTHLPSGFAAFLENDCPQPPPCAPTWEIAKGSTCLFRMKIGTCRCVPCGQRVLCTHKCRHRKRKYRRKHRKSISDVRRCKTHCRKLLDAFRRYASLTTDVKVGSVHHFCRYTNTEISTSKSKTTRYDIVYTQTLLLQDPNMHCTRKCSVVYTEIYERKTKAKGNWSMHCKHIVTHILYSRPNTSDKEEEKSKTKREEQREIYVWYTILIDTFNARVHTHTHTHTYRRDSHLLSTRTSRSPLVSTQKTQECRHHKQVWDIVS